MTTLRVGAQLQPQGTTVAELRQAAVEADRLGVDSIWVWDHFFPLYGDPDASHYEAYTLLAALAADTERADLGALVTCSAYRNPNLLADMARTIDHISDGRFVLGIGSGWFERDFEEYGYEFGTARTRLERLEEQLPAICDRLGRLTPPPVGRLPLLVGGAGEKVTLRLVAEYADMWNSFGPPGHYAEKSRVLDSWCEKVGRNPRQIERTVAIQPEEVDRVDSYLEAGAEHVIVMLAGPFDLDPVARVLENRT
jgi:probable F420-dependent oxidoreductase